MQKKLLYIFCFLLVVTHGHAQQAKLLQFREEIFDFGNVAEEGGPVIHEFVFTNASGRPVKVLSVQASCGCTTPDWTRDVVAPDKTGYIQASYNPKGRPGYFNKTLTVTTDLESTPVILQIKGQVNDADTKPAITEFQSAHGSWKFKTSSFNMGKIYHNDEFVVHEFTFVNAGSKPVTYSEKLVAPAYIRAEVIPKTIAPGAQGIVRVGYNGKLKDAYGFQSDNIELYTDDAIEPVKSINIYATLEDYFPTLTPAEASKAAKLYVSNTSVDFGRMKQNTPEVKEFVFTNTGQKELSIKSVQGNCTCISATASKATIKPSESSTIKITFNPQDRSGTQTKALTIYSNDPSNPVQRITLSAYVEE
jgi:hypothetical protein